MAATPPPPFSAFQGTNVFGTPLPPPSKEEVSQSPAWQAYYRRLWGRGALILVSLGTALAAGAEAIPKANLVSGVLFAVSNLLVVVGGVSVAFRPAFRRPDLPPPSPQQTREIKARTLKLVGVPGLMALAYELTIQFAGQPYAWLGLGVGVVWVVLTVSIVQDAKKRMQPPVQTRPSFGEPLILGGSPPPPR